MLGELEGKGWKLVQMPPDEDERSVIARYNGEPIRAGFMMDEWEDGNETYFKFRSGKYDLELKFENAVGRAQIRVTEADGYEASV